MRKEKMFLLFLIPTLVFGLSSCNTEPDSHDILANARNQIENASGILYSFETFTNNLFNETKYSHAGLVDYYRIDSSLLGFGLHVLSDDEEYFFDGFNFEKLDHAEKKIIIFPQHEIVRDSTYFSQFPFYANNPMLITSFKSLEYTGDTVINEQTHSVFAHAYQQKSHSDSTLIVRYQKRFFIDQKALVIRLIQDLIIRAKDTLQIVDHFYNDYVFHDTGLVFPDLDVNAELEYKRINESDEDEEFTFIPIREGEQLTRSEYIDVNGDEVSLYGENGISGLVMFSFIGCAPCEVALKDFHQAEYNFTKDVNLYYSSFQNEAPVLKRYLNKKAFPSIAFGKESAMIKDFSLYHAPSFALFDSTGTILKAMEGYDESVKNELFKILAPAKN